MLRLLGPFLLVLALLPAVPPTGAQATGLTARGPIMILSNNDFTPANGVVNGSGAAWDPYVIEGWEIQFHGAPQDAYDPRAGIFVRGTDAYFVIRNAKVVQNADRDGIKLQELKNALLEDVEVTGSRTGIHLEKASMTTITRAHVHGNSGPGLVLLEGGDHLVQSSRFEGNRLQEIRIDSTERDEITRNEIRATQGAAGVQARYANSFRFTDNRLSGLAGAPGDVGVFLEGVASGVITGNEIRDFADDGLVLFRSAGGDIRLNILSGNGHRTQGAGLRVQEASEARIAQNQILSNHPRGIELVGASRLRVQDNVIKDNRGVGIELYESSYNLFRNNTVQANAGPGILLNRSSHNDVQSNQVRDQRSGPRGAVAIAGNDNYVANNVVRGTNGPGILIEIWMSGNEVVRNDVRENQGPGILSLAAKERNVIRDNSGTVDFDEAAEARAVPTGETPLPGLLAPLALIVALLTTRACRRRARRARRA